MSVVVAVDSFKGCLSSAEIGETITLYFSTYHPAVEVIVVLVADGGEGMVEALRDDRMQSVTLTVSDPLGRNVEATYLIDQHKGTAIIEMASAAGLTLVEPKLRDPSATNTFGVGQMIVDALDRGIRHFVVGIGGSATNDAGVGMLSALGYRFLDRQGVPIRSVGGDLYRLCEIDDSGRDGRLDDAVFEVACDVRNPLHGDNGAAFVYAPQKGADRAMISRLDGGLRAFATAVERYNGVKVNKIEGAGAAGGLGAAFAGLLEAKLRRGVELILDYKGFDDILRNAELVITGEGKMDRQTLMGKVPQGVLQSAIKASVPVVAIAGRIENRMELNAAGFAKLIEVSPRDIELELSMQPDVARTNITTAFGAWYDSCTKIKP